MATTTDDSQNACGVKALRQLKSTETPRFLSASPDLSEAARLASKYLYSSLKPYTPKSPFAQLLTDGFDAEQIWQQIDLQSEPLLVSLRRQIRHFEKTPDEIPKSLNLLSGTSGKRNILEQKEELTLEEEGEEESDDDDDDDVEEESDDDEEKGDMEEENGVEDRFFKIEELEEYMEDDELRECGLKKKTKGVRINNKEDEDEEEDDGEEGDEGDDEDEELGLMGLGNDEGEDDENAR